MAAELQQVHLVPIIGYCVLGVVIFLGLIMIFWFPVATLICAKRFDRGEKSAPGTQLSAPIHGEVGDSDLPLMFKDQKRKDLEMQPVTKHYNFDTRETTIADERYS